ncbi:MAG: hypothetical protein FD149_2696 [Rhodospirillaceae bacterium]|nr:MAG: hypothetical protein FD149_2696 [Rhodospirillaceae bacterium]
MPRWLKRLGRRLARSSRVREGLCALAAAYIRLVWTSSRWEVIGGEVPDRLWRANQPFVLAFWHGRLLMMPYCWNRAKTMNMLISQHRDGQFIARTVARFGIRTVTGSSSHGGHAAMRSMLKALRAGESVGITPDGPRGPGFRASIGVVSLARLAGVPVVPVSFSTAAGPMLKSWDRFLVPWPGRCGVFVWGQPVVVPRNADGNTLEVCRQAVERALEAATREADRRMGRITAPEDQSHEDQPGDAPSKSTFSPPDPLRTDDRNVI